MQKCSNHEFLEQLKITRMGKNITEKTVVGSRDMDMRKSALKDLANWQKTEQMYKVSTQCLDYHHFKNGEVETVGDLSKYAFKLP